MIKKLIILAVLAGLGYVGWLVWTQHLSPHDKAKIEHKLDAAASRLKKGASQVAKKAAAVVHEKLADDQAGQEQSPPAKNTPRPADAGKN